MLSRKDGATLASSFDVPATATRLRVVSGAIPSKGKLEAFLCGEFDRDGDRVVARARAMRLDRDQSPTNGAWDALSRGDVLTVDPAPALDRARIGRDGSVELHEMKRSERPDGSRDVSLSGDIKSR